MRRLLGIPHVVTLALVLAACALLPCVAQADDPPISDFEAFVAAPTPPVPTVSYAFSLYLAVDGSMAGWNRGSIYESTDDGWTLLTDSCWYSTCVVNVDADPPEDFARSRSRTFRAVLYHSDREYESQTLVVNERRPHFAISVDVETDPGYFTANLSPTKGGTDLSTVIHDNSSVATSCNVYWSQCWTTLSAGHVYYASVEDRDGNVYAISPSYLATSSRTAVEQTAEGLDVPRLALMYSTTTEICDALLTYPYGTHVDRSSVNDQWLACDTAVTARATKEDVLRAVSLAGAGVLSYLLYEKTAATSDPPFEAPYFEFPATLPQPWPVVDLSDSYMIQTRGQNSQDDTDVATGACLWYAARAGLNAREACSTMPIFFTGADVNKATTHDAQQIFLHPEWIKLNYEYGTGKAAVQNRNWYTSEEPCTETPPDEEDQCDEYPFWASEQGGPLARPLSSHLQWVNGTDNTRQGSKYAGFIAKCQLRSGTSHEDANASGGTAFLVIPLMPALHIPTFSVCNRD